MVWAISYLYQQFHINRLLDFIIFSPFTLSLCLSSPTKIVSGIHIDEFSGKKLDLTAQELSAEKELPYSCLS